MSGHLFYRIIRRLLTASVQHRVDKTRARITAPGGGAGRASEGQQLREAGRATLKRLVLVRVAWYADRGLLGGGCGAGGQNTYEDVGPKPVRPNSCGIIPTKGKGGEKIRPMGGKPG